MVHPLDRCAQGDADHDERDRAERQVDVEDPAPGEVVDEEPAEQRADDRRNAEDGSEEPLVAAAVPRGDDVADRRERGHEQAAAAEPLQAAEDDELGHVLADAAERRTEEEEHDRHLEQRLTPVLVAEPARRAGPRRSRRAGSP